jgi:RES domain-containing protein
LLDVDAAPVASLGWRHSPYQADLLGCSPEPSDGRWQHGAEVRGLYLADEPETAIAEWYRLLAERGLPPRYAVPFELHSWDFDLTLADLRDAGRLQRVGLTPPRPGRRTWGSYQDVGDQLHREGWDGLLAPSAARPNNLIVCIFCDGWPPSNAVPTARRTLNEIPPPPTRAAELAERHTRGREALGSPGG